MATLRLAQSTDADAIVAFDQIARQDSTRVEFIHDSIQRGNCYVYEARSEVVAYGVLEYTFCHQGFVSMLYVHPDHRRQGVGEVLMRYLESCCKTSKLFTSTNQSNKPMQVMLKKLGYQISGRIENLDEGDPEIVYFKLIGVNQ